MVIIHWQEAKYFHTPNGPWADPQSWDLHVPIEGSYGNTTSQDGYMVNGIPAGEVDANLDWGPTDAAFENTPDYLNAKWAADQLSADHNKNHFFLPAEYSGPT